MNGLDKVANLVQNTTIAANNSKQASWKTT
nr:MAG TPA: hypothetical protein [Caudoviricetes sp.]